MPIFFSACKPSLREASDYQVISVNFEDYLYSESMSEKILSSTHFVQLETNENCLIGEIKEIVVLPERIFVLDEDKSRAVFIFDAQGKWINTISRYGRGPDEYMEVTNIFFDDDAQLLNLVCRFDQKIMMFDINGELVRQQKLPGLFKQVAKTNFGYVANAKTNKAPPQLTSSVIWLSTDFKIQHQAFPISDEWHGISINSATEFAEYRNELYYFPSLSNYVYRLTRDSLVTAYKYDFGRQNFPEDWKTPDCFVPPMRINIWDRQRHISGLETFKETDQYLICVVLFDGSYKIVFYCKTSETVETFYLLSNPFALVDFGKVSKITDNYIITIVDAESVLEVMNIPEDMLPEEYVVQQRYLKNAILRPISDQIEENPILCFYRLRQ